MPEVSRFFGIVIYFYKGDHAPPHFHARYAEEEGLIDIDTGEMIKGNLSKRILRLVQAWTEIHQEELMNNFVESQKDSPQFSKIKPLS